MIVHKFEFISDGFNMFNVQANNKNCSIVPYLAKSSRYNFIYPLFLRFDDNWRKLFTEVVRVAMILNETQFKWRYHDRVSLIHLLKEILGRFAAQCSTYTYEIIAVTLEEAHRWEWVRTETLR
jgi:hypothetical protein